MQRVLIYGNNSDYIEEAFEKSGFDLVDVEPEMIVAYGGDGTFLESEILFPGVPKLFVRHYSDCKKCRKHNFSKIISKLKEGKYDLHTEMKLEVVVSSNKNKKLIGLNEISLHYIPPRALRFSLKINRKKMATDVISDGVVVATPYGSTAYFNSITRKSFKSGFGIAFNNPIQKMGPLFFDKNKVVKIKIERGEGIVVADCDTDGISVKEGDEIIIKKAIAEANFVDLKGMKRKIQDY
ncbi:hypothetical protein COV16_05165 [Candidatus Woesearchaeota archaeon CG10_big_fil_rev_8_21_14_0_10_34_8]|jgi:NAD+ kinase|nr:MAG: hypothetical protein COV16_05165 [Candidatus Woesearchaeota archaeon CG10_big_fil_rev_8_21_14_0_10_34_8]